LIFRRRAAFPGLLAAVFAAGYFLGRQHIPLAPPAPTSIHENLSLVQRSGRVYGSDVSSLPSASIVRVVDGDTAMVLWQGQETRLRYYGVNTPEKNKPGFAEATERNRVLVGTSVRLAFDERSRDSYGRLLAYVFTEDGCSLDATLVAEGLGRAWTRDGRFRDELLDLERQAKKDRRGPLWEKGARHAR
jgi:endonuclease YncB( thermonuclease family)